MKTIEELKQAYPYPKYFIRHKSTEKSLYLSIERLSDGYTARKEVESKAELSNDFKGAEIQSFIDDVLKTFPLDENT